MKGLTFTGDLDLFSSKPMIKIVLLFGALQCFTFKLRLRCLIEFLQVDELFYWQKLFYELEDAVLDCHHARIAKEVDGCTLLPKVVQEDWVLYDCQDVRVRWVDTDGIAQIEPERLLREEKQYVARAVS